MPALTPTTMPVWLTVAVFTLPVDHTIPDLSRTSSFVPSGYVAIADICTESVRDTPHGDGESEMTETEGDEVAASLHAPTMNTTRALLDRLTNIDPLPKNIFNRLIVISSLFLSTGRLKLPALSSVAMSGPSPRSGLAVLLDQQRLDTKIR